MGANQALGGGSKARQGCIKLLDFSLSSIGWRRGLGRGGAFLLVSPLLGPLPTRSSRGEDGELDAALDVLGRSANLVGNRRIPLALLRPGLCANIKPGFGVCCCWRPP